MWRNARGRKTAAGAVRALVPGVVAVALLVSGHFTGALGAGLVPCADPSPADDLRFQPGTVLLASDPNPAKFGFDKADGQIADAGERTGTVVGNLLGTVAPHPLLDLPMGVGTTVLAPVAGLGTAIGARARLSPEKLSASERDLAKALGEMARQERFHRWLMQAAMEECPGRLIAAGPATEPRSAGEPAVVLLAARVEELYLERTGAKDTSYALRIKTRNRLVRAADGVLLYDQLAEYRSDKCLFVDWTLRGALEGVVETGYRVLAEDLVARVLTTADQPLRIGAGHANTSRWRKAGAGLVSRKASASLPPSGTTAIPAGPFPQLISYPVADTGILGVFSTATVAHVTFQQPLTRDEAGADAVEEVGWLLDGLDEHPNPVVSVVSSVAVVPVGLWKQGAALVKGISPKKLREADRKLREAAQQAHPPQDLAVEVARQLGPTSQASVVLVNRPPGSPAGTDQISRDLDTALEIHVQTAALVGERGTNPKLALCVEAQATLFRARDGWQLYSCPVQYRTAKRTFGDWAAHDARLFRHELQRCYRELSLTIAGQLAERGFVPTRHDPLPILAKNDGGM